MKLIVNDPNKDTRTNKVIKCGYKTILIINNDDVLNFKEDLLLCLKGWDIDLVLIPQNLENYFKSDICKLREYLAPQSKQFIYF